MSNIFGTKLYSSSLYLILDATICFAFSVICEHSSINAAVISSEPKESKFLSDGYANKSFKITSEPLKKVITFVLALYL